LTAKGAAVKVRRVRWIHRLLLVACALGLALMVAASGPRELWREATRLGWSVPAIIALFGVEHGIRAVAWWCCYRPGLRPPLRRLFWARLAGYAINSATPSATVGGEVARAGLTADTVAPLETMTAISVDRLADTLADCLIGLCGLAVILGHAPFPLEARLGLLAAAVLLGAGVAGFFVLQRRGRLVAVLTERALLGRLMGARRMQQLQRGGQKLDARLRAFHAERPRAIARALVFHLLGSSTAAAQVACFLSGLGIPVLWSTVLQIYVVGVALDLFSFFIPARLGAQEGARMVALALAGFPARLGLLFSLVLRIEQLTWALVGFLAYVRFAGSATDGVLPTPAPGHDA
jgi:Lysylphosphatidylglycerol synthase TM region